MTDDGRMALIYQESVRALDQQQAVLDALRARAGVLIAAASVATTFLGGGVADDGAALGCWGWWAVGCFVGVGLLCVLVLMPWKNWRFTHSVDKLLERYDGNPDWATLAGMHRRMADINQGNWEDNKRKLSWLQAVFLVACLLLVAEVAFWLVDVIG
jgi:hypothetical protein